MTEDAVRRELVSGRISCLTGKIQGTFSNNRHLIGSQGRRFTSKKLDMWAYANGVTLDFSRPGKPTDKA